MWLNHKIKYNQKTNYQDKFQYLAPLNNQQCPNLHFFAVLGHVVLKDQMLMNPHQGARK